MKEKKIYYKEFILILNKDNMMFEGVCDELLLYVCRDSQKKVIDKFLKEVDSHYRTKIKILEEDIEFCFSEIERIKNLDSFVKQKQE